LLEKPNVVSFIGFTVIVLNPGFYEGPSWMVLGVFMSVRSLEWARLDIFHIK